MATQPGSLLPRNDTAPTQSSQSEPTGIARSIAEHLVEDRLRRPAGRADADSGSAEKALVEELMRNELDRIAAHRLGNGLPLLSGPEESDLQRAVLALVLGMGRIQPLLDDPDVSDIHIRGSEPVWLKLRDGSRQCGEFGLDFLEGPRVRGRCRGGDRIPGQARCHLCALLT